MEKFKKNCSEMIEQKEQQYLNYIGQKHLSIWNKHFFLTKGSKITKTLGPAESTSYLTTENAGRSKEFLKIAVFCHRTTILKIICDNLRNLRIKYFACGLRSPMPAYGKKTILRQRISSFFFALCYVR